ncbi:MAG: hypothetical protein ISS28_07675 [Candidatus Cloacimonetes bacterium]|nr:hypothetical protein [Candidatus Cloacimonadota bacterium]
MKKLDVKIIIILLLLVVIVLLIFGNYNIGRYELVTGGGSRAVLLYVVDTKTGEIKNAGGLINAQFGTKFKDMKTEPKIQKD